MKNHKLIFIRGVLKRDFELFSVLSKTFQLYSKKDKVKIVFIFAIQTAIVVLDLIGVAMIGLIGALSASKINSQELENSSQNSFVYRNISSFSIVDNMATLALIAVLVLGLRTIFSIYFTRKVLVFFALRTAEISTELASKLFYHSLLTIQQRTSQETVFVLTRGVEFLTMQIFATIILIFSDVILIFVMTIGLAIIDTWTAAIIFILFAVVGIFSYRQLHTHAQSLGIEFSKLSILSNQKIVELFSSYREAVASGRRGYYIQEIGLIRSSLARFSGQLAFLPYWSKFIIEGTILLCVVSVGVSQILTKDSTESIGIVVIFLAAGSRIAPSFLRVQQGMIQIRSSLGQANRTLDLIDMLMIPPTSKLLNADDSKFCEEFEPTVSIKQVSFKYPGAKEFAIKELSLNIKSGQFIAIIGPSGCGKTTLIDLILGIIEPQTGIITVSGFTPPRIFSMWPGSSSYLPQDVGLISGTVRENLTKGYPPTQFSDQVLFKALEFANLVKTVHDLPLGLDSEIGERGSKLSGGQAQRLGIARAMLCKPKLLVLDEATSSLDTETESEISDALLQIKGLTTVVMIAHKLLSIKHADLVVYMENGNIISQGTFQEVRMEVPDFDKQAKWMGL